MFSKNNQNNILTCYIYILSLQKRIGAHLDRRIVIIGIILVILSFFIASAVIQPELLSQQNYNNTYVEKIIVAPNSIVSASIDLSNASVLVISYTSTVPINFYFVNESATYAFKNVSSNITKEYNMLSSIEGNGLYLAINDSFMGTTYPYNANLSSYGYKKPFYVFGNSIAQQDRIEYSNGTYYAEFYNHNDSYANITYRYYTYSLYNITNTAGSYENAFVPGSLVTSIIFIVGIILTIYGLLSKKDSKQTEEKVNKEAYEIYAKLEAKNKKTRKPSIKNKKKGKRKRR